MARLPAAAPINLLQITAHWGAPAGTGLAAMVRGGAYVPDLPVNSGIPTAPPINALQFLNASNERVVLSNKAVTMHRYRLANDTPPPANFQVGPTGEFRMLSTGALQWWNTISGDFEFDNPGQTTNYPGEWLTNGGNAAAYEAAVFDNGAGVISLTAGSAYGTYYNLASGKTFRFTASYADSIGNVGNFIVRIRPAGGGTVIVAAALTITASA